MEESKSHDLPAKNNVSPPEKPTGFAKLAKQISSRTTDLLAIAIVLVAGLSMGERLIEWWSTDPEDVMSPQSLAHSAEVSAKDWNAVPVTLEFGEKPYAIRRQTVRGDRKAAVAGLIDVCRSIVQTANPPKRPLDSAEQKLLQFVETMKPAAEEPGVWRIDHVDGPVTMVVATRKFSPDSTVQRTKTGLADRHWRVVCWGLAFPVSESHWTLFTFRESRTSAAASPGLPRVALPEGSRRLLSLRAEGGGALIGFAGQGPAEDWRRFFDQWFHAQDWQLTQSWKSSGTGWSARFVSGSEQRRAMADVQFSRSGESRFMGILSITPLPSVDE